MDKGIIYYFRKTHLFALMGLVSSFTFNINGFNTTGFFVMLLCAATIGNYIFDRKSMLIKPTKSLMAFILFYTVYVVGVIYSQNQKEALFVLEKKLSLILFPLLAIFSPKISQTDGWRVLKAFIISCVIVCLVCIVKSSINYAEQKDLSLLFYHSLSMGANMHAGYLSMYLCFSICLVLYLFHHSEPKKLSEQVLYVISLLLLTATTFMLSSRLQILLLIIIFIGFVIIYFELHKNILKSITVSLILGAVLLLVVLMFPKNRERFKEAINYKGEYALSKKWGEKQMRFLIWDSSLELIGRNILFGVGTGDVQDELQKVYITNEYISLTYWPNTRFNAHNQFFETTIAIGLIGLIAFFLSVFIALKEAKETRNFLFVFFLIIFLASCITESMLERQNGVVFYAFFSSFLIANIIGKSKSVEC